MKQSRSLRILSLAGLGALLFSCQKDIQLKDTNSTLSGTIITSDAKEQRTNRWYGSETRMGNGMARTYIVVNDKSTPVELGIELTSGALEGLPETGMGVNHELSLHQKAQALTPFDHVDVGWNPNGHPPPGIYSFPHFDFHFYMISREAQMAIPPYTTAPDPTFDNFPPMGYLPADYVPGPGGVPQMGKHWFDVTSHEFTSPGSFDKTFIYGTYDGAVTFYEPMITRAYILGIDAGESVTTNIKQPLHWSPSGTYYPSTYTVSHDEKTGKYSVSLGGFQLH
jgi:hypothetical protein